MYVIKRDGREEPVAFDKITARIKKLSYGLSAEFCDPVRDGDDDARARRVNGAMRERRAMRDERRSRAHATQATRAGRSIIARVAARVGAARTPAYARGDAGVRSFKDSSNF